MPTLITEPAAGLPPLPPNIAAGSVQPQLRYQGAEALVYYTHFPFAPASNTGDNASDLSSSLGPPLPAFLKHRPRKEYRHPLLDAKLTRHRILAEARVLAKLRREGVSVPALYALDWESGWMIGEWIDGDSARAALDAALPAWLAAGDAQGPKRQKTALSEALQGLMRRVGSAVGRMHDVGVVHGDLTTSNLLLRPREPARGEHGASDEPEAASPSIGQLGGDVVIIDFGLAMQSVQEEDRAVDLYVLERAFGSTHAQTESLFEELLDAYGESYKGARVVLKRLKDVRMRGRKKIMIG